MTLRKLAFSFCCLAAASFPNCVAAETVLRLALQQSLDDPIGQSVVAFKKEVEAASKGELKIDVREKGQTYQDYQVPEAVGGGAIEMGVTPLAQYAQFLPVAGIFMQPFLFNFDAIVEAAAKPGGDIRAVIDGGIGKETGAHVLWWEPNGWNVIFSKGAIPNPQSISKHNVRVFDEVAAEFVTLCGGTAQVISESKQVEALELKLVDSTMASLASLRNYELWHSTDTISDIRHSANILIVIVNEDIFQKLTPEQRNILMEASKKAEAATWRKFGAEEAGTYSFAKKKGMTIQSLTPDDVVAWRVCSSSILESFMSKAGPVGARLMAAYGKLRTDPCCSQGATAAFAR